MSHPYLQYVETLRNRLNCETQLHRIAEEFFDLADRQDFTENSHNLTQREIHQQVASLVPTLESILASTTGPSQFAISNRPIAKKAKRLRVKSMLKLENCDLFHGWAYHKRRNIVFFFFEQQQKGLLICTQKGTDKTDFFRFRVPCIV